MESEMPLHGHAVNWARQAGGIAEANIFWLWGERAKRRASNPPKK
jgi:hypothetical protein